MVETRNLKELTVMDSVVNSNALTLEYGSVGKERSELRN